MFKRLRTKKAFTLIELIVVMAIIGILVLLAMPKFMGYTKKAHLTEIKSNIKQLEGASERYYIDKQDWPRLNDTPYNSSEIESFAQEIKDKTGAVVKLDADGKYYPINYDKLQKYIQKPKDNTHYIIQNPVGEVFYLDDLTPEGKAIFDESVYKPEDPKEEDINQLYKLQLGEYVKYGSFNGHDIIWQVVKKQSDDVMLFMTEPLKNTDGRYLERNYDIAPAVGEPTDTNRNTIGSNNYYYSDIRAWLNETFYSTAFANNSHIKDTIHDYVLMSIDSAQKTSGSTSHIHNVTFGNSLQNYNTTAYKRSISDKVYLVNIDELVNNIQPTIGNNYYNSTYWYWTRDSYNSTSCNVRAVYADSTIHAHETKRNDGRVRVGLNLKSAVFSVGTGTQADPYVIQ